MKTKFIILFVVILCLSAPFIWRATENMRDITHTKIEGEVIFVSGTLNARTFNEIKQALENNVSLTTMVLEEIDGSIDRICLLDHASISEHHLC